eukprot:CAMPEP_0174313100 /NCGR_PEP_ID=MMETSP0810-20121108/4746_1 /TAXON_ID=73025 ORGANISM="Eutreptiella gymnastica-like, Strain CCMP1594" /NCGR_SAMPLE_ID=MMETSP0810 /ASSEMBLY_ACC=CAM_ASM_000659 /LENGTH=225 /DNA_ID=CAMNT_0015421743 /DNA_START=337 /DNA_END=1016 /DNA_ORIENTATION=-
MAMGRCASGDAGRAPAAALTKGDEGVGQAPGRDMIQHTTAQRRAQTSQEHVPKGRRRAPGAPWDGARTTSRRQLGLALQQQSPRAPSGPGRGQWATPHFTYRLGGPSNTRHIGRQGGGSWTAAQREGEGEFMQNTQQENGGITLHRQMKADRSGGDGARQQPHAGPPAPDRPKVEDLESERGAASGCGLRGAVLWSAEQPPPHSLAGATHAAGRGGESPHFAQVL